MRLYDKIFKLAEDASIGDDLRRLGDMDFQATSLKRIVYSPKMIVKLISSVLGNFLK